MARPREVDRDVVRTVVVRMRVRPRQRRAWEAKARQHGLSLSEWLRAVADRAAR